MLATLVTTVVSGCVGPGGVLGPLVCVCFSYVCVSLLLALVLV